MAALGQLFPVFSSFGFTTVFDAGSFLEEDMCKVYLQMEKRKKLFHGGGGILFVCQNTWTIIGKKRIFMDEPEG